MRCVCVRCVEFRGERAVFPRCWEGTQGVCGARRLHAGHAQPGSGLGWSSGTEPAAPPRSARRPSLRFSDGVWLTARGGLELGSSQHWAGSEQGGAPWTVASGGQLSRPRPLPFCPQQGRGEPLAAATKLTPGPSPSWLHQGGQRARRSGAPGEASMGAAGGGLPARCGGPAGAVKALTWFSAGRRGMEAARAWPSMGR